MPVEHKIVGSNPARAAHVREMFFWFFLVVKWEKKSNFGQNDPKMLILKKYFSDFFWKKMKFSKIKNVFKISENDEKCKKMKIDQSFCVDQEFD